MKENISELFEFFLSRKLEKLVRLLQQRKGCRPKNPQYRSNLTFFGKNSKKNVKFYEKTVASFRIMWYSEGIENEEHERAQRN